MKDYSIELTFMNGEKYATTYSRLVDTILYRFHVLPVGKNTDGTYCNRISQARALALHSELKEAENVLSYLEVIGWDNIKSAFIAQTQFRYQDALKNKNVKVSIEKV